MKKRCLLTYKELESSAHKYSLQGLKKLNRNISNINDFPYSYKEQFRQAQKMATKLSIQGVQPKLSAQFSIKEESFVICEKGGTYIIKPQVESYPHLPENEDLTMKLAQLAKIETPWHGLILSKDNTLSYVIKRFDRATKNKKLALEDFGQLIGAGRSTKYLASMERVAQVIEEFCTYPTVEGRKLFRMVLFSYLIGNEDLHIKNFSLITRNNKVELSPAYDLVNSTLALAAPEEEMALELNGKKKNFIKGDFENYAQENLYLTTKVIQQEIEAQLKLKSKWEEMIRISFLNDTEKRQYKKILNERLKTFR